MLVKGVATIARLSLLLIPVAIVATLDCGGSVVFLG